MLNYLRLFKGWALLENSQFTNIKEMKETIDDVFIQYLDTLKAKSTLVKSGVCIDPQILDNEEKIKKASKRHGREDYTYQYSADKSEKIPLYAYRLSIPKKLTDAEMYQIMKRAYRLLSEDFLIVDLKAFYFYRSSLIINFYYRKVTISQSSEQLSRNIKELKEKGYEKKIIKIYVDRPDDELLLVWNLGDFFTLKEKKRNHIYSKCFEWKDLTRSESSGIRNRKKILENALSELNSVFPDLKEKATTQWIDKTCRNKIVVDKSFGALGDKLILEGGTIRLYFEDKLSNNQKVIFQEGQPTEYHDFRWGSMGYVYPKKDILRVSALTFSIMLLDEKTTKQISLEMPDLLHLELWKDKSWDFKTTSRLNFPNWVYEAESIDWLRLPPNFK